MMGLPANRRCECCCKNSFYGRIPLGCSAPNEEMLSVKQKSVPDRDLFQMLRSKIPEHRKSLR